MKQSKPAPKAAPKKPTVIAVFPFRRINFILTLVGLALVIFGFILMIGGGAEDPGEFSEAIFNARRLTLAPLLILAGYVLGIVAIMYRPKAADAQEEKE